MDSNNLFRWATSELSQDAFICWLMSFAMKENHGKNPALESCAMDLIHRIPGLETASEISYIERQSYNIDVLLTVGDYYVIIEDKTFTGTRKGQISGYKQALMSYTDTPPEKIKSVLYTISIQPQPEQDIDCVFTLEKLIEIMLPYKSSSKSDVFSYYVEHLVETAEEILKFGKCPIGEWYGETYKAFFEHLKKEGLVPANSEYQYVANPNGGFIGLWWDFHGREIDPDGRCIDQIYMQIAKNSHAENLVSVRISVPSGEYDVGEVRAARQKIFEYFSQRIEGLQKRWHWGNSMAVCYIVYDETNYREQITKMQKVFDDMLKELRLP